MSRLPISGRRSRTGARGAATPAALAPLYALFGHLRPHRRGIVTPLGKAVLLVCGLALLAGLNGDGIGFASLTRPADAEHHPRKKPEQRWGSAADQEHVVASPGNRTRPKTLRSKYPLRRPDGAAPARRRNAAWVAAPPETAATGFDARTSKEAPNRRTARERVFVNADGTETTEFSATPVNFWNGTTRSWTPIDPRPTGAPGGWRNRADTVDVRLAGRADAPGLASLTLDAGHAVGFGAAGAAAVSGRADDTGVTYQDALPGGTDVRLEPRPGGLKETLVLSSPDAPRRYLFPLRLTGLTPRIEGRQVTFVDAAGRRRATVPAGYMWDSAKAPASSTGVTYSLATSGGAPVLQVDLDERWLNDPAREFPVSVDPTVTSDGADSSLVVHGNGSHSGGSELLVGNRDGSAAASYIKFSGLIDKLRYHRIFGAQLQIYGFDAASCSPRKMTVHPVTQSWSPSSDVGYPGPDVGKALAGDTFAYGYIGSGQSKSSCPAKPTLFNLGASGRKLVQTWADGGTNNGLSLRASASDKLGWKRITGTGTPNPPTLFVTHSPYNADYAIPDPVPEPPVMQNQAGKVKITVTNLGAETWTPGTYYLAYRAYDARTGKAVTQRRAANLTRDVARGARATLDATIQPMAPGRYFLDFTMVRNGGKVFTDEQVPPGRIVLEVFDVPPVLQELYPQNGYQAQTLTPQLWARAVDIDAPPGSSLKYKFELCDQDSAGKPVNCSMTPYQSSPSWTPPAGKLVWNRAYQWRGFVKDATTEVPSPYATLLTQVPQPAITSNIAGAPYASRDREFDPQAGNLSTAAVDAPVASVGPELNLLRTYNSLDPRRAGMFGAGWTTRYDMKITPDDDGSGSVVVTYPDGQEVRFGKNPDGAYVPPQGRTASLTFSGTEFVLRDKSGTTYRLSGSGKLTKITDSGGRSVVLTYDFQNGLLSKVQVSNSQTNKEGRALTFAWTGSHVTAVSTDKVDGAPLTWNYTYTGDLLTKVCAPGSTCTNYTYAQNSHYHSAVLDDRPESYWRLGESEGTGAGSDVAVNLGKDHGTYKNVKLLAHGATPGSVNTAATFDGETSTVELPKGALKKSRDAAVELWFKADTAGPGGPLIGYQDKALGTAASTGVPLLYHGEDGKLRGQFWNGTIAPITSAKAVNDGYWHHAVLSSMSGTQTLYLDGAKVGTAPDPYDTDTDTLTYDQIGAANVHSPSSWAGWGAAPERHYKGDIDEVAVYTHPLGPAAVAAHHRYGLAATDQLTEVTLPGGGTAARAEYDPGTARITEYTDRDGGTWKIGASAVYGGDTDLRRGVEVRDPSGRPYLYEYDALAGRMIRSGSPTGIKIRDEDRADPAPSPSPSPTPTEVCNSPDPGDTRFCTEIPPDADGPVFDGHDLDGMAIRTFEYDDHGFQKTIRNEVGEQIDFAYDDRGNVTSQKTCRSATECHTEYTTYPAAPKDPFDPRNDLPTEKRDGRSSGPTDNRYRTTYTYHSTGQLLTQSGPDGSFVKHTYTDGAESAPGGGAMPPGLLLTTTDALGAVTKYLYYDNGDLARVTAPSGLVTTYTYDALGRRTSETEVSDAQPDGVTTTYTYDAQSRPLTSTEPATTDAVTGTRHQRRTTNTYDADGNVLTTEISDLLGGDAPRRTTNEYDELGHPVRVTDPEGNETSYGYDRFGNKTWMVDARGNRHEYGYTARNMIAEVRLRDWKGDPDGVADPSDGDYLVTDSYAYDLAGRMARQTDAMGQRVEYTYYKDGLLQKTTLKDFVDADGTKRDYVLEAKKYDGAGNLIREESANGKRVTEQTYNPSGTVAATVNDPDGLARRTDFRYDANGNVTKTSVTGVPSNVPWITSTAPEVVEMSYDPTGNLTKEIQTDGPTSLVTSHTYDQRGLRTSTTAPRGNVPGADPAAYTSTFGYDELNHPTTVTGPEVAAESAGSAPRNVKPTQTTGYNTFDEAVAVKDPLGNVTRTSYDRNGRATTATAPSYTPPGGAPITPVSRTAYDPLGNVTETTDPSNNVTRYTYDRLNHLTKRDEPARDNGDRAVWNYTYTRTGEVLSVTDPTGARVESTYDALDRQVTQTQVERYPRTDNFTTRHRYDDAGNLVTTTSPTGTVSTNTYNSVGEVTQTQDADGVVIKLGYDYSGRRIRESDGLGRTSRSDYDRLGRLVNESDVRPDGTTLREQSYTYDPDGDLTATKDPYDRVTAYAYDAGGRLVRQVEPVSDTKSITTSFGYDAAGNRTRYTDGRGNPTIYTVNSLGLPESVVEASTPSNPEPSDRTWTATYDASARPVRLTAPGGITRERTFDPQGRITAETGAGAEASTAERTRSYDLTGRLLKANGPGGTNLYTHDDRGDLLKSEGPSGNAAFAYDGDGQMTSRTDAAGTSTYGYVHGRLKTATDAITNTTQTLGYDAAGMPKTIDYGAGRVRTFGYDEYGRLSSDNMENGAGTTMASVGYEYDLNNRMTRKVTTGTVDAGENTYTYDHAGRLTSWQTDGKTVPYDWDDSGNRVRNGDKTATYDARNRLISDGDYTYTYSSRGTLATRTNSGLTEKFSFDAFDRLISGNDETYTYDGLDRVASRDDVSFQYAGLEDAPASDGTASYARDPSGELLAVADSGTERLTISDQHGDVTGTLDPTSDTGLAESTAYSPFGEVLARSPNATPGNVGYQGDWTDPGTGQVNMGARWYNPGTGAFDSRDTVNYTRGDSILANRYTYAAGTPLTYDDDTGNWPSCGWCKKATSKVVTGAAKWVAHQAVRYVVRPIVSAVRWAAHKVVKYAKSAWHRAQQAWHTVSNAARSLGNWAAQKAAEAKHAVEARNRAIMQRARNLATKIAKTVKVPALIAATKPLLAKGLKLVSAAASLPANLVSMTQNVIHDVAKTVDTVYHRAIEAAGPVLETVSHAYQAASEFAQDHAAAIAGIATGVVVGAGCGALIGWTGVGAVACGALAGAAGALVEDLVEGGHNWKEVLTDVAVGGTIGAITAGLGSMAGTGLRVGAQALRSGVGVSGAARLAGAAARLEGRAIAGLCRNSFAAGTPVLMADGTRKPIEKVKVGDKVKATDPTTGRTTTEPVTDTITGNGFKNLVHITVDTDGDKGTKTGTITATDGHPFWTVRDKQWHKAADLKPGMWLRTAAGTHVQITATTHETKPAQVHNLTINRTHTFYAGAGPVPVLTHNCGFVIGQKHTGSAALASMLRNGGGKVDDYINAADGTWQGPVQSAIRDSKVKLHINLPGGDFIGGAQRGLIGEGNATELELSWVARAVANGERKWSSINFWAPNVKGGFDTQAVTEPDWGSTFYRMVGGKKLTARPRSFINDDPPYCECRG
ncbi:polymorphic toxin-type HINT domain-containing protein [Actinomadura meridiana]|uniref:Polymorphic toxin-type HINT domain-containing protein n=1 Tax=Actinomadura meridiana TaxID=559626 RepID=A0ABP8C4F3_9ACTN